MTDYDPFPNETDIERAPALVRAHELVSEGMESGDDLKFWKHMTAGQRIDSLISDTGRHSEHGDEDENPRRAIEESLLDASRKRELLPTPSISPPRTAKRQQLQSPTIMDFFSAGKQMPKQLAMRACDIVNGDLYVPIVTPAMDWLTSNIIVPRARNSSNSSLVLRSLHFLSQ